MAVGTLLVMDWELPGGLVSGADAVQGLGHAQTMAFTTLVFFQLFNTFNCRFERHSAFHRLLANRWLWFAVAASVALQVAVVHVPFLQRPFRTVPLTLGDWFLCVAAASSVVWIVELEKLLLRPRRGDPADRPRPLSR
jgi:Ca2+-transporting ATPase